MTAGFGDVTLGPEVVLALPLIGGGAALMVVEALKGERVEGDRVEESVLFGYVGVVRVLGRRVV